MNFHYLRLPKWKQILSKTTANTTIQKYSNLYNFSIEIAINVWLSYNFVCLYFQRKNSPIHIECIHVQYFFMVADQQLKFKYKPGFFIFAFPIWLLHSDMLATFFAYIHILSKQSNDWLIEIKLNYTTCKIQSKCSNSVNAWNHKLIIISMERCG